MRTPLGRIFGLGTVLALLAGPALAQPYGGYGYGYGPGYGEPRPHDGWYWHERHEAEWRAHERHEAWWRATHGYGYGIYHYDGGRWGN